MSENDEVDEQDTFKAMTAFTPKFLCQSMKEQSGGSLNGSATGRNSNSFRGSSTGRNNNSSRMNNSISGSGSGSTKDSFDHSDDEIDDMNMSLAMLSMGMGGKDSYSNLIANKPRKDNRNRNSYTDANGGAGATNSKQIPQTAFHDSLTGFNFNFNLSDREHESRKIGGHLSKSIRDHQQHTYERRESLGASAINAVYRTQERRNSYLKITPYRNNSSNNSNYHEGTGTETETSPSPTTTIPFFSSRSSKNNTNDLFKSNIPRLQRLVEEMRESLSKLSAHATCSNLETWACIIYESMSAPSRTFHSVQHVFDISKGAGPISKLAAFFHDVVYYGIDGGLNDRQEDLIGDVICSSKIIVKKKIMSIVKDKATEKETEIETEIEIETEEEIVKITDKVLDRNTNMVLDVFGFRPGQILDPFKGMNEFLSAVMAVRCYQSSMEILHLMQITACIEATIPFRKINDKGQSPCDVLYERLKVVNETYDLQLDEHGLVETVQRSADLGNRDLANFSTPERAVFLSNTWNLLPESNINLRNTKVFRVSDYALALKKMTGFFQFLDAETIYLSFRDEVDDEIKRKKTIVAALNVKVATKYMLCKRLSIGVVAAISELSGGDAPLALFLGDLPEPHFVSTSIEDLIDVQEPSDDVSIDWSVFELLMYGRESESKFDIKNSPLAAYLYSLIGDEGIARCLKYAVHPMDEANAKKLLLALPEIASATIVAACAEIAVTREEKLHQMMLELKS